MTTRASIGAAERSLDLARASGALVPETTPADSAGETSEPEADIGAQAAGPEAGVLPGAGHGCDERRRGSGSLQQGTSSPARRARPAAQRSRMGPFLSTSLESWTGRSAHCSYNSDIELKEAGEIRFMVPPAYGMPWQLGIGIPNAMKRIRVYCLSFEFATLIATLASRRPPLWLIRRNRQVKRLPTFLSLFLQTSPVSSE